MPTIEALEVGMSTLETILAAAFNGDPLTSVVAVVLGSLLFVYLLACRLLRLMERLISERKH